MLDGEARSSASSKKASEKCAATSARCPEISKRPSAPAFTPAATTLDPKCGSSSNRNSLTPTICFVRPKNQIRSAKSIRLLFLTARAPGHSELPTKIFLDLVEANRRQLIDAGVSSKNISASTLCTACRPDLLFSYRAEKGVTGRMMGVAGIKP